MITFIVLIILLAVGIALLRSWDYDFLGMIITFVAGILLLLHAIAVFTAPYKYGVFLSKRNAFEQTLTNARESNNEYESAAILKDVAVWNQELAKYQYLNSILLLDCYIDDRIESLTPIE